MQHDAQEFLAHLLDKLHEDLNRVLRKPLVVDKDFDPAACSEAAYFARWQAGFRSRNDSKVVDLFFGAFRSETKCPTCGYFGVRYEPFSMLSLPVKPPEGAEVSFYAQAEFALSELTKHVGFFKAADTLDSVRRKVAEKKGVDAACFAWFEFRNASKTRGEYLPLTDEQRRITDVVLGPSAFLFLVHVKSSMVPAGGESKESERQDKQNESDKVDKQVEPDKQDKSNKPEKQDEPDKQGEQGKEDEPKEPNEKDTKSEHRDETEMSEQEVKDELSEKEETSVLVFFDAVDVSREKTAGVMRPLQVRAKSSVRQLYAFFWKCLKLRYSGYVEDFDFYFASSPRPLFRLRHLQHDLLLAPEQSDHIVLLSNNDIIEVVMEDKLLQSKFRSKELDVEKPQGTASGAVAIEDCLKAFTASELLDEENAWFCNRCKSHRKAHVQLRIQTLPPILIVHLKRFRKTNTGLSKATNLVDFPLHGLDLAPYAVDQQQPATYSLFATVNHFGHLQRGHYVAYAKLQRGNQPWVEFDDEDVKPVKHAKEFLDEKPYILFYRRQDAAGHN